MGDHPADLVASLFAELDAWHARGVPRHHTTVAEIAEAFGDALGPLSEVVAPLVSRHEAESALKETLTALVHDAGYEVAEREPHRGVYRFVEGALYTISQDWQDSIGRHPTLREIVEAFAFVVRPDPARYLAVREPLVRRPFHHPLLGVPRVTLPALLDACDTDARELLDAAARVARIRTLGALGARPGAYTLRSTDLLRALQVTGRLDPLEHEWTPAFADDTARVRALLATDTAPPDELALDPAWVGPLTAWRQARPGRIDADALVGALDRAALGELCAYHVLFEEGLVTRGEVLARFIDAQVRIGGGSAARGTWGAWLDRDGELDALTDALARSSRVVIEAEDVLLVPALVQAWAARAGRLGDLGIDGGRLTAHQALVFVVGARPSVVGLYARDTTDLPAEETVVLAVRRGSRQDHAEILAAFEGAPVLRLGSRRDADLLARWLGERAHTATTTGERFDLHALLEAIEAADEADRWSFDWERLAPWRALNRGLFAARVQRFLKKRRGAELPTDDVVFERFAQSEERLRWLVELDAALP